MWDFGLGEVAEEYSIQRGMKVIPVSETSSLGFLQIQKTQETQSENLISSIAAFHRMRV
jgi:hypothetical protein